MTYRLSAVAMSMIEHKSELALYPPCRLRASRLGLEQFERINQILEARVDKKKKKKKKKMVQNAVGHAYVFAFYCRWEMFACLPACFAVCFVPFHTVPVDKPTNQNGLINRKLKSHSQFSLHLPLSLLPTSRLPTGLNNQKKGDLLLHALVDRLHGIRPTCLSVI